MSAKLLGIGFSCDMGTPCRKLILLKLIDACEDDGSRIYPAVATIARAAQCSPRQVQRELAGFVDIGLLAIVREGGKGPGSTTEYRMDLALLRRLEDHGWRAVVAEIAGPADEGKGDTESPLKGDNGAPRVTPATEKGDSWSRTTPYDPSIDPSAAADARARDPVDVIVEAIGVADDPNWFGHKPRIGRWTSEFGWDLDLDILPTIRRVVQGRGPPRSPAYFEPAIAEHRARRLAPPPTVNLPEARHVHGTRKSKEPDWDAAAARLRAGRAADLGGNAAAARGADGLCADPGILDAEAVPGGGYRVRG